MSNLQPIATCLVDHSISEILTAISKHKNAHRYALVSLGYSLAEEIYYWAQCEDFLVLDSLRSLLTVIPYKSDVVLMWFRHYCPEIMQKIPAKSMPQVLIGTWDFMLDKFGGETFEFSPITQ